MFDRSQGSCTLEEAYERCIRLARRHYENFTVASWLLSKEKVPYVAAIYAFCRFVDDLGDEAGGDRLALLDQWEADLQRCYGGTPLHPYMVALQDTIARFDIPSGPFLKLIQANRMDQLVKRHPTYADLLYYCDHSANPVGHLFLYLFGYRDSERQRLADFTCTALQLANFWQDVRRDLQMGRIYLPLEDMARFSYGEDELLKGVVNANFRRLMAFEVERARNLFQQGLRLVDHVEGVVKLDILLFTRGGLSVLDAIERQGYDVLYKRPVVTKGRKAWLLLDAFVRLKLRRAL
ncbi:MAG: squalene synthase HpnC [Chloroflexi bacterium]|nr:squalene synthase HpnC [Chloroflexota bacterium]